MTDPSAPAAAGPPGGGGDDVWAALEAMGRGDESEDDYGPPVRRVEDAEASSDAEACDGDGAMSPLRTPREDLVATLGERVAAALRTLDDAALTQHSIDAAAAAAVASGDGTALRRAWAALAPYVPAPAAFAAGWCLHALRPGRAAGPAWLAKPAGRRATSPVLLGCCMAAVAGWWVPWVRRLHCEAVQRAVGEYLEAALRFIVLQKAVLRGVRSAQRQVAETELSAACRAAPASAKQSLQLRELRAVYSAVAALGTGGVAVVAPGVGRELYAPRDEKQDGCIAFDAPPPRQALVVMMNLVTYAEMRCEQMTTDALRWVQDLAVLHDAGVGLTALRDVTAAAQHLAGCNLALDTARLRMEAAQRTHAARAARPRATTAAAVPSDAELARRARGRCQELLAAAAAALDDGDVGWEEGRRGIADALREWDAYHRPQGFGGGDEDDGDVSIASGESSSAASVPAAPGASDDWAPLAPTEVLTMCGTQPDPREEYRHYPAPSLSAPPVPEAVRKRKAARGEVTRDVAPPTAEEDAAAAAAAQEAAGLHPLLRDLQGELRAALRKAT